MNINKLQHVLKVGQRILVHFPMYLISMIFQMLAFIMMSLFFIVLIGIVTNNGAEISHSLIGLNGMSRFVIMFMALIIGGICGGLSTAIEKYLSQHK